MRDRHLAAALSTAYEAGEGPLTLSVAPRARPAFRPASFEEPRTASATATSRTAAWSIQNAFRRQVLPSTALAAPFSRGSPPPVPRLCRLVPGSRRLFTAPRLSPGVARPSASRGFSPRDAMAERRLSTSATYPRSTSTTFEPPEPRTPRFGSPRSEAPSPRSLSRSKRRTGGSPKRASREFTGQGPSEERERSSIRLLSWRSLAMRALPQPDRLGHLLSRGSLTPAAGAACAFLGQSIG